MTVVVVDDEILKFQKAPFHASITCRHEILHLCGCFIEVVNVLPNELIVVMIVFMLSLYLIFEVVYSCALLFSMHPKVVSSRIEVGILQVDIVSFPFHGYETNTRDICCILGVRKTNKMSKLTNKIEEVFQVGGQPLCTHTHKNTRKRLNFYMVLGMDV